MKRHTGQSILLLILVACLFFLSGTSAKKIEKLGLQLGLPVPGLQQREQRKDVTLGQLRETVTVKQQPEESQSQQQPSQSQTQEQGQANQAEQQQTQEQGQSNQNQAEQQQTTDQQQQTSQQQTTDQQQQTSQQQTTDQQQTTEQQQQSTNEQQQQSTNEQQQTTEQQQQQQSTNEQQQQTQQPNQQTAMVQQKVTVTRQCNNVNDWSRAIANGQIAPWTYVGGQEVKYNGHVYRATSGGQEVPGTTKCTAAQNCPGVQWILVGKCSSCGHIDSQCAECVGNKCIQCEDGYQLNLKKNACTASHQSICHGIANWSSAIANGQVAPWTYKGGDLVQHNGDKYQAMWGGQEVPGTHKCTTQQTCSNNGWQWMLVGHC